MQDTFINITIVTFGILLLANLFFRLKSFRTFKQLAELNVYFGKQHIFDKYLLEKEVIAKYPQHKALILSHINSIKLSMRISMLCMLVLTICGAVLMYYRR